MVFDNKTFYQYIFQLIAYTITSWILCDLLLKCLRAKWFLRLSTCLLINIVIGAFTSLGGVFLNIYLILFMGREKSGPTMFLANVVSGNLLYMCYISTMLLMVERICALNFPMSYRRHYKLLVVGKVSICLIGGLIYSGTTFVEWPVEAVTTCDVFLCLLKVSGGFINSLMKLGLGIVTMVISIFFYFSLQRYVAIASKQYQLKNLNILIAASVANEFLCIFFPQLVKAISAAARVPLWETLGTYVSVGSGVNALVTALIYKFLIKDPSHRWSVRAMPAQSVPANHISVY